MVVIGNNNKGNNVTTVNRSIGEKSVAAISDAFDFGLRCGRFCGHIKNMLECKVKVCIYFGCPLLYTAA